MTSDAHSGLGGRRLIVSTTILVLCTLTATACGSTLPATVGAGGQAGADGQVVEEFGPIAGQPDGGAVVETPGAVDGGVDPGAGGSGVSDGSVGTSPGPGGGGAPAPTAAPKPGAVGKGVTAKEINVGIWYVPADADAGSIVGVAAANAGIDGKKQAQAVVDYVNKRGGIAGRAIKPNYYQLSSAEVVTPAGRAREAQRMCAQWTEDSQVFAMVSGSVGYDEALVDCAAKSGTPYVVPLTQYLDEPRFNQVSQHLYVLAGFTVERRELTMAERLAARGFLKKGTKVGLMVEGLSPVYANGVNRALKPALAELGVEVVAEAVYPDWINSPWSNYVLQFRQAGVTHVLFTATSGLYLPVALFMRAADGQAWRPQYGGIGSDMLPKSLAENAPASQLANAVAVGWQPAADLTRDGGPINQPDAACRTLMRDAGQPEWNSQGHAYCDAIFFLRDALAKAPSVTPAGMAAAVDAFGTSWPSVATWTTRFARGRHDGAAQVNDLTFDPGCSCFVYTGARAGAR